jgi:hypothetical protein
MKTKSFLSGISTKIVLSIVALSGTLLTGCYKDDGVDAMSAQSTYTISGTVLDAETMQPITGATVTSSNSNFGTASTTNGAFTQVVTDPGTYTLNATAEGYKDASATVEIKKVNVGQSAVYSPVIYMQPKNDGKYTVNFIVADENGDPITGATVTVKELGADGDGEVAANNTVEGLEGGKTYIAYVKAKNYVQSNQIFELDEVRTATSKNLYVTLSKRASGTVKIYGEVKIGKKAFSAKKIELKNAAGKLVGIDEGYTYNFEVSEDEFTEVEATSASSKTARRTRASDGSVTKSATFNLTIVDNNDIEITVEKTYDIVVTEDGTIGDKKNDTNVGGESGSTNGENHSTNQNIVIVVTVDEASEDVTINNVTVAKTFTNTANEAIDVEYQYTGYTGSTFTKGDTYDSALKALGEESNFYDAIVEALNPNSIDTDAKMAEAVTKAKITVNATSILTSVDVTNKATKVTRTVTGFKIDGKDASVKALTSFVDQKVSTIITTAAGIEAKGNQAVVITHDGTDLSHGTDSNAGGGSGSAE